MVVKCNINEPTVIHITYFIIICYQQYPPWQIFAIPSKKFAACSRAQQKKFGKNKKGYAC